MERYKRRERGRARPKRSVTTTTEIRALDVLEYLNQFGGQARVCDIAGALNFPQSSTSRLLAQLSGAGYLSYDRVRRIYRLSARAALLTAKSMPLVFGPGEPLRMMEALRQLSGGTAILTSRNQTELNIVHIEKQDETTDPCFHVGMVSPLVCSASGKVMLSNAADSFIHALIRRYNAGIGSGHERVRPEAFFASPSQVRQRGYLVHPVEAARRTIGGLCRGIESPQCATVCCLSRRAAHMVAPVRSSGGAEIAAIVGIPPELEEHHLDTFAAEAQAIIRQHMPTHA